MTYNFLEKEACNQLPNSLRIFSEYIRYTEVHIK